MKYRVYTENKDEIVRDVTLTKILSENNGYLLVESKEDNYILFTNAKNLKQDNMIYCLYLSCKGGSFGTFHRLVGVFTYSKFDLDEYNHMLNLYDENISELFQYMKRRYGDIIIQQRDIVKNTKPIMRVKSVN